MDGLIGAPLACLIYQEREHVCSMWHGAEFKIFVPTNFIVIYLQEYLTLPENIDLNIAYFA
jgi:hypothetical protein